VHFVQVYQAYTDFSIPIYECRTCGCRFCDRDESAYDFLHSRGASYSSHKEIEERAKHYFSIGALSGLRAYLSQTSKFRFIINKVESSSQCEQRVLELGCSRGYLSSYFILSKNKFLGVDVSSTAVEAAIAGFGPYFSTDISEALSKPNYYDVIYHVGTIGCVEDPVNFILQQLAALKPGGKLLFNAPNREVCDALQRPWLSTSPPDLVTLFRKRFWEIYFSDVADVRVQVEKHGALDSYRKRKKVLTRHGKSTGTSGIEEKTDHGRGSLLRKAVYKALRPVEFMIPSVGNFKRLETESGVHVEMRKRH